MPLYAAKYDGEVVFGDEVRTTTDHDGGGREASSPEADAPDVRDELGKRHSIIQHPSSSRTEMLGYATFALLHDRINGSLALLSFFDFIT